MIHKCEPCDYETWKASNWERHIRTKKHIKLNLQNKGADANTIKKIIAGDKLTCANCGKSFAFYQGLYRHKKRYCKNTFGNTEDTFNDECSTTTNDSDSDSECDIETNETDSKHKINNVKYKRPKQDKSNKVVVINESTLLEKNEEIKALRKQVEIFANALDKNADIISKNADTFNKTADVSNKSMSIMKFAMKNFSNAPPIKQLPRKEIMKMITYEEKTNVTKRPIVEILIFHYLQKKLYKFVGDIILNFYKKASPEDQSVWNADVARLSFIVKQVIGEDGESEWVSDKSGIKVLKIIINPLYDRIKEIMKEYMDTSKEFIDENNEDDDKKDDIMEMLKNMTFATEIIKFINLEDVQQDTLKYIAPYFGLDKIIMKLRQ